MNANSLHRRDAEDAEFPQREITEAIIGAAIEVHRILGPGMLESIYQRALQHKLALRKLPVLAQVAVRVAYKGVALEADLRLDLIVGKAVIVEVKSVAAIEDVHRAQLLTYLRLPGMHAGLIINFNVATLRDGIRRVANSLRSSASSAPLR
jgi:GxxExxY protein